MGIDIALSLSTTTPIVLPSTTTRCRCRCRFADFHGADAREMSRIQAPLLILIPTWGAYGWKFKWASRLKNRRSVDNTGESKIWRETSLFIDSTTHTYTWHRFGGRLSNDSTLTRGIDLAGDSILPPPPRRRDRRRILTATAGP